MFLSQKTDIVVVVVVVVVKVRLIIMKSQEKIRKGKGKLPSQRWNLKDLLQKKQKPMKFNGQMRKILDSLLHFHQFNDQLLEKPLLPEEEMILNQLTSLAFILQMTCLNSLQMKVTVMQSNVKKNFPEKHQSKWGSICVNKMKIYIGLCIRIIKLPSLHDYWQQKHSIFVVPSFGKVMSCDRYKPIHCYLNFCHGEEPIPKYQPRHDPLLITESNYCKISIFIYTKPKYLYRWKHDTIQRINLILSVYSIKMHSIWYQSMDIGRVKIRVCAWVFFMYR